MFDIVNSMDFKLLYIGLALFGTLSSLVKPHHWRYLVYPQQLFTFKGVTAELSLSVLTQKNVILKGHAPLSRQNIACDVFS